MKKPLPHQKDALKAIRTSLASSSRGKVIMASGTGKTLVSWWAAREYAEKSILALVPSLALARQLYTDWRAEDVWRNGLAYRWLVICSDPSVTRDGFEEDDITFAELKESIKDVTNDPSEVFAFLSNKDPRPLVVISTYQSAPVLAEGMPSKYSFDLGIFDEAHKTAGRAGKLFSLALQDKNVRIKKRLFFTATPRRSSYRPHEGKKTEIFHMDDVKVYGKTIYELSYMSALAQGLVSDYEVLMPVIDRVGVTRDDILAEDVVALHAKILVALKAIKRFGIKKMFSYHGTNSDAELARQLYERSEKSFTVHRVSGAQNSKERSNILERFAVEPRAIVTNARCLSEGVNVPVCDAVAFMTPRRSKVDVIQSVGRACRLDRQVGSMKDKAYVVIPIFIESSETLEEAKDRSAFRDAFDTLHALREHNTALSDDIRYIREYLRKPEASGPRSVDEGHLKLLVDDVFGKGIAGLPKEEFLKAFRVMMATELRATVADNKAMILEYARKEAARRGRA